MNVLIVGAGSVGQLYGFCLAQGGAEVDVYVREKYRQEALSGYVLYDRNEGLKTQLSFQPEEVLTVPADLKGRHYDAIIICVPSTGLRGTWFEELIEFSDQALIISLQPGLEDRSYVAEYAGQGRVVTGLITSVSYPAPLPGEEAPEPGTAFWFPPLVKALFQGSDPRLSEVLEILSRGGLKSEAVSDLSTRAGFASGVLTPFIAGLESVGWSFQNLRSNKEVLRRICNAINEAHELLEILLDTRRPLATRLLSPTSFRGGLIAAPRVTPFDLEIYFQVHFTKVGAQTRRFLEDYIRLRSDREMASPAITALLESIR